MEELVLDDFLFEDFDDSLPPPPVMLIPPPPLPPWMDKIPDCLSDGHCINYPAITSINSVTNISHISSVISVLAITSFIMCFISVVLLLR